MNVMRVWLVILLSSMLWEPAAADTVYKYRGADGKLVYSDQPPTRSVVLKELRPRRDTPGPEFTRWAESEIRAYEERDRLALRSYESAITQADQRLARATRARDLAAQRYPAIEEPQPGERVANINGYSRLRPQYFGRVDDAQRLLAATEQEYYDALDARQQLR